ncbi:glycosyltransferase family 4 protein [Pseudactinotalea terrae]|uniref:glycosyltransferase family 4 protein n=1 Tax=Pseudactinotalea terrae TaxID=1743262 RepID=UPI0012E1EDF0|nr:glycosyltransferase family 4 protein [Pseudactinotalea terrae]
MAEESVREQLKVLQVAGSASGGTRSHVRELAAGLTLDHRVVLAAPGTVVRPWIPGLRSRLVEITDRPRPQDAAAVSKLRALGKRADVVHAHGLRAGALSALALAGVPTPLVVTLHNLPVGGPAVQAMAAGLERVVAGSASAILGVSGDIVDHMRGMGAPHVERALIPAPISEARPLDRAVLGIGDAPLVVTIARLAPQKGLDLLLDAAALLTDRVPGVVWAVAGDGPRFEELKRAVEDEALPVRLLGRRDDVPALLAAADVVVSTAEWEGQPVWLQEALHAGAPIVATDVGGTREVTGAAARLVRYGDADLLVAQIAAVLREPRVRDGLRAAARERAAELPRAHDALAQVLDTYDSVLV